MSSLHSVHCQKEEKAIAFEDAEARRVSDVALRKTACEDEKQIALAM